MFALRLDLFLVAILSLFYIILVVFLYKKGLIKGSNKLTINPAWLKDIKRINVVAAVVVFVVMVLIDHSAGVWMGRSVSLQFIGIGSRNRSSCGND